jgi:hypothetical protein
MTDDEDQNGARAFKPWCVPTTERSRSLISTAITTLTTYEDQHQPRRRARHKDDEDRLHAALTALLGAYALMLLIGAANFGEWDQRCFIGALGFAFMAVAIFFEDNEWWLAPGSFRLRKASLVRQRWFYLAPGSTAVFEVVEGTPDSVRIYSVRLRPPEYGGALHVKNFQSAGEAHLLAGTIRATADNKPPGDAMPPG